jgi:succinate dehydrogenase / fumarate reductase, cytochrome b subunit
LVNRWRLPSGLDPGADPKAALPSAPMWLRWHSLLGVVPLAGYLLLHLGAQSIALWDASFERWLHGAQERRLLTRALELGLIYAPLSLHVALGVRRVLSRAPAVAARSSPGWGSRAQWLSALVLVIFLAAHIWQTQGRRWTGELDGRDLLPELCASLSSTAFGGVPLVAIGYLLGIAAAAFHAAHGLYRAGVSSGLVTSSGEPRLARACVLAGLGAFVLGALMVVQLATGSLRIYLPS